MNSTNTELTVDQHVFRVTGILPSVATTKAAILIHGGPGGNSKGPDNLLGELAASIADLGIAAYTVDLTGSSELPGDYSDVTVALQADEIRATEAHLRSQGFSEIGMVGESLGGTVALSAYTSTVQAVVLLFPAIRLCATSFEEVLSDKARRELSENGYVTVGAYRFNAAFVHEIETLSVERELDHVRTPTLIIHGDADRDVPVEQSRSAFASLTNVSSLELIKDGGHGLRRPEHRRRAVLSATSWLGQFMS